MRAAEPVHRQLFVGRRVGVDRALLAVRFARIEIALRRIGSRVQLSICDDGSGFDIEHEPAKGIGLAQMEHRVRKIGGRLEVQSTVGRGTCITADVYLEPILTTV